MTSSAGHGPVIAARNVAAALSRASRGTAEISVIDLPREMGPLADLAVNRLYNFSLRHGLLWNRIGVGVSFRLDWSRIGSLLARGPPEGVARLRADAVVFTTPWLVERALVGVEPGSETHAVVLDLAPPLSPGWSCPGFGSVYAPTREANEGLRGSGTVLGVPVFPAAPGPEGVPCVRCDGAPSLLVMGGRTGYGGLPAFLRALSGTHGYHVTALAGVDPRLRAAMERIASRAVAHIEVLPFVPDVAPLIAAHDAVLAKPGTMTIADALSLGRPLLLDATRGLMPQEIGNARFVEDRRAGIVVRSASRTPDATERVLEDTSFSSAARSLTGIAGAERIAAAILRHA